jgi:IPT/TIG domain/Abnormal spindle-like microcephaly-assoc'd, ASPM-SPD-2-Hydin
MAQRSGDGGATWSPITLTGALANAIEGVAIDPTDVNTVVVVYSGTTSLPATNRTKHVFRTTNNGVSWDDISGTDGGSPDSNLPDIALHCVAIDGSATPHRIMAGGDAAVMESGDNGATWQVLGFGLPTVDCLSLAIDNNATPPLLRVGTYGRSAFELTRPSGQTIGVMANLSFGTVAIGASSALQVRAFNVGSAALTISGFSLSGGGADFQVAAPPAFPVTVAPGAEVDFTVQFQPSAAGNQTAAFQLTSDDPSRPTLTLNASGSTPSPLVVSIAPNNGGAAGGDSVTITGSGFSGATAVNFGANAATAMTVNSDTQITATSPAGSGTVDVTVVGPGGTSATSAADQFTYT